jgi:iron complex transport system substrate-binding protein
MRIWGIDDKVVAVDNSQKKNEFLKVVCPRIESITDVGSSKELNYETLAATNPDVVIIRAFATDKERQEGIKKL